MFQQDTNSNGAMPKTSSARLQTQPVRNPDDLISSNELADVLKVSLRLPESWRLQGVGPKYIRVGGRRVLYRWGDVTEYLNSRRFNSTSEEQAA